MQFQQWFNNLPRKEQTMLLIGGGAVLVYIVFVLVLAPMSKSVSELQRKNQVAAETLAEVQRLAAEYKQLESNGGGKPAASRGSLTRLVDSSVQSNQLTMSRFQPSSTGDVQVRFENAVFNNIVAWLNDIEVVNGVMIKDLTISPGSADGLVNVSVRLNGGA